MSDLTPKSDGDVIQFTAARRGRNKNPLLQVISGRQAAKKRKMVKLIRPALRAQIGWFALVFASAYLAVRASLRFPGTWIELELPARELTNSFSMNALSLGSFPLFGIIPVALLLRAVWPIFNSEYRIDSRGLEARTGILWINLRQPRLRYEDIRGIEVKQSLFDRLLFVGDVVVGSAAAAHEEGEVVLRGVSNPNKIQRLLQKAIDRKKRSMIRSNHRTHTKPASGRSKKVVNGSEGYVLDSED